MILQEENRKMKLRNKKTGEIWDIGKVLTNDYPSYDTLEQITEDFEDYKPAEPLIKDEKIRKAVRAWAEINSIKNVLYAEKSDRSIYVLTDMSDDDFSIELVGWIPTLKDGESYTIDELCGEVEE